MNALTPERPASAGPARDDEPLLVFAIGGQEFALPIGCIVEIVRFRPPTPVPGAAGDILGIVPLRGRIVTIIDGRRRLGIAADPGRRPGSIIVLRLAADCAGLAVDAVSRVARGSRPDGATLPPGLDLERPALFRGVVTRSDGGCVLLLDTALLLGAER